MTEPSCLSLDSMDGVRLLVIAALLGCSCAAIDHFKDVRCLSCQDVASPDLCLASEHCGLDEVCFTREFFDHNDRRAFRLGCESKALCDLASLAHAFGRRGEDQREDLDGQDGALSRDQRDQSSGLCFQCCASDECNQGLCESAVGANATGPGSHGGAPLHCPAGFERGPRSCLYFSTVPTTWLAAREACKKIGSSLVKIASKEEDMFLLSELKHTSLSPNLGGYWTGGHLDSHTEEYRWMDGSVFNYTRWASGQPMRGYNTVLMVNPARNGVAYPNWEWSNADENAHCGYICEKRASL